jgi:copper chaperone CopZ
MALEETTFKVSGIHCEGCEQRIARALSQMSGVRSVSASHTAQEIEVTLDSTRTSVQEVAEKLEFIGFPPAGRGERK